MLGKRRLSIHGIATQTTRARRAPCATHACQQGGPPGSTARPSRVPEGLQPKALVASLHVGEQVRVCGQGCGRRVSRRACNRKHLWPACTWGSRCECAGRAAAGLFLLPLFFAFLLPLRAGLRPVLVLTLFCFLVFAGWAPASL